jgi:hypothetical protein
MEEINFGWLAVWVLRLEWLSRKIDFVRRLGEATAPGKGSAGRALILHRIPWHLHYN